MAQSAGVRPALDLYFLGGALPGSVNFTRASSATDGLYTDAAGSGFNSYSTNVARMLTAGLLIEEARTQSLLNSAAPVTQTSGTLATGTYVLWAIGTGTVTSSAGTATASGLGALTGSQGTFQTITVTVAGTLVFTVSGSINRYDLELGAYPSSFISSAGSTATRAADIATIATSAFAFNPNAGTLIVEGQYDQPITGFPRFIELSDGTANNVIQLYPNNSASAEMLVFTSGVTQFQKDITNAFTQGSVFKAGLAWANSNFGFTVGGATPQTAATGTVPTLTDIRLGQNRFGGSNLGAGHFRRIRYFNQRLPNARLQALTV